MKPVKRPKYDHLLMLKSYAEPLWQLEDIRARIERTMRSG